MARLIFNNVSLENAIELAKWYENQGEENADIWFKKNQKDSSAIYTDFDRLDGGWLTIGKEEVNVYLVG